MVSLVVGVFTLKVAWLTIYVAPFIPIVTAAVTRLQAPGWLKVSVTAAFSTVVAFVTTAIEQKSDLLVSWSIVGKIALSFGVAMGSYIFLRPVHDKVAQATAERGIG